MYGGGFQACLQHTWPVRLTEFYHLAVWSIIIHHCPTGCTAILTLSGLNPELLNVWTQWRVILWAIIHPAGSRKLLWSLVYECISRFPSVASITMEHEAGEHRTPAGKEEDLHDWWTCLTIACYTCEQTCCLFVFIRHSNWSVTALNSSTSLSDQNAITDLTLLIHLTVNSFWLQQVR